MPRNLLITLAACLVAAASACGRSDAQDITKVLAVTDVKTGWWDAGVENGKNKLLPSVILTLKNTDSVRPLSNIQLNAVIRRVGEPDEWGGAYEKVIGTNALPPGASTKPIMLRSNLGYTGIESRAQMLKNKQFVDAHVQVFVKHGGAQWVKLGEWLVARELLTQ